MPRSIRLRDAERVARHYFEKVRNGFMEINPIVLTIKDLRERTDALRGYL
ncbi:hypothetical protein [Marinobacter changyiensis]|nr:hypothetical protein [Marinobacter changyiensis]